MIDLSVFCFRLLDGCWWHSYGSQWGKWADFRWKVLNSIKDMLNLRCSCIVVQWAWSLRNSSREKWHRSLTLKVASCYYKNVSLHKFQSITYFINKPNSSGIFVYFYWGLFKLWLHQFRFYQLAFDIHIYTCA